MHVLSIEKFVLTIILFCGLTDIIGGQEKKSLYPYENETLIINSIIDSLPKLESDSLRLKLNIQVTENFKRILCQPKSFSFEFDSLKHIGKLFSPDKKFRIVSWNVPFTDGTHRFFSLIQMNPEKDTICKIFVLKDNSTSASTRIFEARLTSNNWYGALYYNILPVKTDKGTVYTLLGLRFNDLFTTQKVIESMYFDITGMPMFGASVFYYNNRIQTRIIFEYGINVSMSLRFDERLKMIVFDHLAPSSPLYTNNFKFYGPDFTFDGLKFDDGKWMYIPNVDFRNSSKTVPYKKNDRRPK